MNISEVKGTIVLTDGAEVKFSLEGDGYFQWGAETSKLGETVDVVSAMQNVLIENDAFDAE